MGLEKLEVTKLGSIGWAQYSSVCIGKQIHFVSDISVFCHILRKLHWFASIRFTSVFVDGEWLRRKIIPELENSFVRLEKGRL